jgi:hypothetical protein
VVDVGHARIARSLLTVAPVALAEEGPGPVKKLASAPPPAVRLEEHI